MTDTVGTADADGEQPPRPGARDEAASQIKGSTLLMAGRVIGVVANMLVQVLIVRALSKSDYGAFAYGLSFVTTAKIVVTLGHGRTITRFFAIYDERRQYDKLVGAVLMELVIVTGVGAAFVLAAWLGQGLLVGSLVQEALAAEVLVIILMMAPVEALDEVLEGLLAVFANPKAVFVRRYVIAPALKVGVVAALVAADRGVIALAIGYVAVSAAGLLFYGPVILRTVRDRGLGPHLRLRGARMPVREVFAFSTPSLSTELLLISMSTVSVVILGYFSGTTAVAAYRAVRPGAMLNSFVIRSFNLLFLPMASRLHAREDVEGLQDAYWRTAAWIAVLTFPMLAMSTVFAEQMTVTLFGERYRDSTPLLQILSVGFYVNAALGFNAVVLQVVGRLRYLVVVNTAAAVVNVALCLALIPPFGATGVVVAASTALVLQNLCNQAGLRHVGIAVLPRSHARVYAAIVLAVAGLAVLERLLDPGVVVSVLLAGAGGALVFRVSRGMLGVIDIYPSLARVPIVKHLVGRAPTPAEDRRGP